MSYHLANLAKKKKEETPWNYDVGIAGNDAELKRLLEIAQKNKLVPPENKPKVSLLDKLFGLLNAGETAPAVYEYLKTGDVGKAAKAQGKATLSGVTLQGQTNKKTYEDVLVDQLGMKKGVGSKVAGIAGDILLDPTTYFGGAIAKGVNKAVGKTGAKVIKAASKVPVVGPVVEGATKAVDELGGLFSPLKRITNAGLDKETGQKYLDLRNKLIKEGRYSESQIADMLNKMVKSSVKEGGKDVGKKIGQAIETGSSKTYHGTGNPIEELVSGKYTSQNYYGQGFYTTDNLDIAKGYSKKGGKTPTVYDVKASQEASLFDMEKKLSKEDLVAIPDFMRNYLDGSEKNLREVYDAYRKNATSEGISADEIQEGFDAVRYNLENRGFSGLKHTGGLLTGKAPHEVKIYWEPEKDVSINKLEEFVGLGPKATQAKETIQKSFKDMLETERAAGIEIGSRENYLTHTLTDEARQFTKKYGYDIPALQRGLGSANKRTIEGTIPEINKEFRAWLEAKGEKPFDLFEEDAFKAFGARSKSSVKALNAKKIRDTVGDTFGIADEDLQSRIPAGFFSDKTNIVNGVKYVPMPGIRIPKEFGDDFVELGGKSKVWVPEAIAKDMDEINKVFINDDSTNAFLKIYDSALNWFKGSVTGVFPSFHANNLKGGVFNNTLAGVWDPSVYKDSFKLMGGGTDDVFKFKNFKGTAKELATELSRRGAINAGGYLDVFGKVDEAVQAASSKLPKKGFVKRGTQGLMNKIETINRGALVLDTLKKGGTIDDAVKKVFKYQFDYSPEAFAPFERNVMRRIIPFYTWSRNNIPLMLEAATKQPGKIGAVGKVARDISNTSPEDRENMPDYMKESFPVKMGNQVFYGANLPIEDINRITPKGFMSSLSPIIKTPLERYTGKNFFFDQPIEDYKKAPSWFKSMPKPIKDAFGYTEKKGAKGQDTSEVDPYRYHLLTSVLGRYVFTADKLADPKTTTTIKALYAALGVKGADFDPKQLEYYNTKEDIEKLKKFLIQKGAVREFKTVYEPKK